MRVCHGVYCIEHEESNEIAPLGFNFFLIAGAIAFAAFVATAALTDASFGAYLDNIDYMNLIP